MAGRLTPTSPGEAVPLLTHLDRSILGMVAAAYQVPAVPENLPFFVELGKNIIALETLRKHVGP